MTMTDILKKTDFFKMYLGEKNNQNPKFKKGVNYLNDMKGLVTNDEAQKIVDFIATYVDNKNIIAVESSAKIGTLTSTFLDNPKFYFVIAYEPNHTYRKMLHNNLEAYKYSKNKYSIPSDDNIFKVPKEIYEKNPVVIHLSPNWIPDRNSGFKIGNHTLEEILDNNRDASIITLQLPRDYQFHELKNYKIGNIEMDNFYLYYAVSIKQHDMSTNDHKSISSDFEDIDNYSDDIKKKVYRARGVLLKPEIKIPEHYSKGISKSGYNYWNENNTKEWKLEVKKFLREKFLPKIGLPKDKILKITDEESMETWESVFTHETYDRNVGKNYEQLETLGDAVMKTTFADYIIQRYPTITPGIITELTKKMLSGNVQTVIAYNLELPMLLRTRAEPVGSDFEDMLEALFGALLKLGNEKLKMLGYPISSMFANMVLDMFIIVPDYIRQDAATEVRQIFQRLKWGIPKETPTIESNGQISFKVELPGEAIADILRLTGVQVRPFLGIGKGKLKKIAAALAYDNASEELEKYGINKDFAIRIITEKRFSDPNYKEYKDKLLKYLQKEGKDYVDIKVETKKKKDTTTVYLWGIKEDDSLEYIYSKIEDGNIKEPMIYTETIKEYLNNT